MGWAGKKNIFVITTGYLLLSILHSCFHVIILCSKAVTRFTECMSILICMYCCIMHGGRGQSEDFCPKLQNLGLNPSPILGEIYGQKLKFCAPMISSVRNLELSVGKL